VAQVAAGERKLTEVAAEYDITVRMVDEIRRRARNSLWLFATTMKCRLFLPDWNFAGRVRWQLGSWPQIQRNPPKPLLVETSFLG
jgi:hypothetical protein